MDKTEKKLKRLNNILKRGRVRHSLILALVIPFATTVGTSLGSGGFLPHLLNQFWISYLIVFVLSYFFWPVTLKKVRKKYEKMGETGIPAATSPSVRDWMIVASVTFILICPTLFQKEISIWLMDTIKNETVTVSLPGNGKERTELQIPALYIGTQDKSLSPDLVYDKISIVADITTLEAAHANELHGKAMKTEDILSINFINTESLYYKNNYENIYSKIEEVKLNPYQSIVSDQLVFSKIDLKKPSGDRVYFIPVDYGLPADKQAQNICLLCEEDKCAILAKFTSIPVAHINFKRANLEKWPEIFMKSQQLLQGFFVEAHHD